MIQIVLAGRRGLVASLLLIVPSLLGAYGYLHGLRDHMIFIGIDAPRLVSASDRFIPRTGKALFLACSDSAPFSSPGLTVSAEGPDLPRGCREVTSVARILPGQVFPLDSTGPFRFIAGELQVADITLPLQVARFALWAAPIMLVLLGCVACAMDGVSLTKTRTPRTPEQYSTVEDVSAENTIDYLRNHYEASGKDVPPDLKERLSKAFKRADGASADTDMNQNLRAVVPRPAHPAGSALVYAAMGALVLAAFAAIVFVSWFVLVHVLLGILADFAPPWAAHVLRALLQ